MSSTAAEVAEADRRFAAWMRSNLAYAAGHFGVEIDGEPVYGWRLRSAGAAARDTDGAPLWLRVVSEFPRWAHGEFWTGNADANRLPDSIPRPRVLDTTEWTEGRYQRAELRPGYRADRARPMARPPTICASTQGGGQSCGAHWASWRTSPPTVRTPIRSG